MKPLKGGAESELCPQFVAKTVMDTVFGARVEFLPSLRIVVQQLDR